jgi:hypothetical protein
VQKLYKFCKSLTRTTKVPVLAKIIKEVKILQGDEFHDDSMIAIQPKKDRRSEAFD